MSHMGLKANFASFLLAFPSRRFVWSTSAGTSSSSWAHLPATTRQAPRGGKTARIFGNAPRHVLVHVIIHDTTCTAIQPGQEMAKTCLRKLQSNPHGRKRSIFSTQHKGFVNKQFPENWAGPHLLKLPRFAARTLHSVSESDSTIGSALRA